MLDDFVSAAGVSFDHLFARDGCVKCLQVTPTCPDCQAPSVCQFTAPTSCTECPKSFCGQGPITPSLQPAAANGGSTSSSSSSGPNVGAIAGGVIGGIAVIGLVTYLVWRCCIKTKRQPLAKEPWDEEQDPAAIEAEKSFAARRDQRSSTHTAHSIASTVLTRASNIIQIAYIPGVTNRATPTSPTLLVPPVPPIPIALSQANSPAGTEEQHFFVPGDLRDSTYSALSGYTDRTSYARTSYAPRSSIASTIYGKNAVIAAPVQTGMRAKPAMVSVKSAAGSSISGSSTPPVPEVDYQKYGGLRPPSPANSTFSVGSTFLNNASAHTATPARAMVVRVGSGPKKPGPSKLSESSEEAPAATTTAAAAAAAAAAAPAGPIPPPPPHPGRSSVAVTLIEDSPTPDQGPFSDPPTRPTHQSNNSLSAVIEEATRRASQRDANNTSAERERSPFGDEHATHDV